MVLATTSRKDVLRDLEMLNNFSAVIRAPNLTESTHLVAALEEMESFSKDQLALISKRVKDKK